LAKGFYQSNGDVLTDACWGDWMEKDIMTMYGTYKNLKNDSYGVPMKEVEDAAITDIEAWYKNRDACGLPKMRDDGWNWCMENPYKCAFWAGAEDRILDNIGPLIGTSIDLWRLMMADDSCYTAGEQVGEVYRLTEDIGQIVSRVWGFDLTWEQSDNA